MTIGTDINRIEGSTVYDSTGDKVGRSARSTSTTRPSSPPGSP